MPASHADLLPAFGAEVHTLLIDIFHIGTGSHDAGRKMAMHQSEHVTQLVNNHFLKTLKQQFIVFFHSVLFVSQPVQGGYANVPV